MRAKKVYPTCRQKIQPVTKLQKKLNFMGTPWTWQPCSSLIDPSLIFITTGATVLNSSQ